MTKRLDNIIGEQDYNGLLASTTPSAIVATAEIAAGEADIPAGTVIVKGEDGKYKPASEALTAESIVLVLSEDAPAAGGIATGYKPGNFARGRLVAAEGYTLTATDFDYMRQAGILSEDVID